MKMRPGNKGVVLLDPRDIDVYLLGTVLHQTLKLERKKSICFTNPPPLANLSEPGAVHFPPFPLPCMAG